MTTNIFDNIIPHIKASDFILSVDQPNDSYFPDFLKNVLEKYSIFYKNRLLQHIDDQVPFRDNAKNVIISKIESLITALTNTVNFYYQGKINAAYKCFSSGLDNLSYDNIKITNEIDVNRNFYRARKDDRSHFSKSDLFHIDFSKRHLVSTNRYSVPGFPSLYLGDSTYVCWEEFNRYKLRDLWFVRMQNQRKLNIIKIQRIQDFLAEIAMFPLSLACSIKVKYPNGNFKPEYIIPQLLLEYVSLKDDIEGIKFPSTKVDYTSLDGVQAYNYVFPVKNISSQGFCPILRNTFFSTEPTSLDLEEIIYNPTSYPMIVNGGEPSDNRQIELIKSRKDYYSTTSFGKLETSLMTQKVYKL